MCQDDQSYGSIQPARFVYDYLSPKLPIVGACHWDAHRRCCKSAVMWRQRLELAITTRLRTFDAYDIVQIKAMKMTMRFHGYRRNTQHVPTTMYLVYCTISTRCDVLRWTCILSSVQQWLWPVTLNSSRSILRALTRRELRYMETLYTGIYMSSPYVM